MFNQRLCWTYFTISHDDKTSASYFSRSSSTAVLSMKSTISLVERQLCGCRILISPHAAVSG